MTDLSGLFDPDRVAVIGATDREGSVGRALLENLRTFDGEVVPVNPNRETVLDADCYPTIGSVPSPTGVDLAVVAVPAAVAVDVVGQVGEQGIETVVVITAGFSETDDEGQRRERALAAVAAEYDLDLVGPNSVGVISTATGLNGTFLQGRPPEGSLSLMSQSGAFIAAVIGWATQHNIGFNNVVSLGNETVLDEVDFLRQWDDDPETDVILAYVEDIDDGRAFIETAQNVTASTPVVVIKSGRTEAGAAAAKSHTGSMAGSDEAYRAALEQAGVLRAGNIQRVFDFGQVLAGQPRLDGDRVAVITNGGGPGVLTTDAVGDSTLDIAEFGANTRVDLDELLPAAAEITNPLDIIGDADLDRFGGDLCLGDTDVDQPGHGAVAGDDLEVPPGGPVAGERHPDAALAVGLQVVVRGLQCRDCRERVVDVEVDVGGLAVVDQSHVEALAGLERVREVQAVELRAVDVDGQLVWHTVHSAGSDKKATGIRRAPRRACPAGGGSGCRRRWGTARRTPCR